MPGDPLACACTPRELTKSPLQRAVPRPTVPPSAPPCDSIATQLIRPELERLRSFASTRDRYSTRRRRKTVSTAAPRAGQRAPSVERLAAVRWRLLLGFATPRQSPPSVRRKVPGDWYTTHRVVFLPPAPTREIIATPRAHGAGVDRRKKPRTRSATPGVVLAVRGVIYLHCQVVVKVPQQDSRPLRDWKTFVTDFYKMGAAERQHQWEKLTAEQRTEFELAAKAYPLGPLVSREDFGGVASLGARAAAWAIDTFVCYGVIVGPLIAFSGNEAVAYAALSLGFGYFLLCDALPRGQSLGKRVFRIAVVDWRTGQPCCFRQSLIRNLAHIVGIFDWGAALRASRRRAGDELANTAVVVAASGRSRAAT